MGLCLLGFRVQIISGSNGNRELNNEEPHLSAYGTTTSITGLGLLSPAAFLEVTRTFTVAPEGRPFSVASLSNTVSTG